jgi:hypothetical protein
LGPTPDLSPSDFRSNQPLDKYAKQSVTTVLRTAFADVLGREGEEADVAGGESREVLGWEWRNISEEVVKSPGVMFFPFIWGFHFSDLNSMTLVITKRAGLMRKRRTLWQGFLKVIPEYIKGLERTAELK